jgi:hypothetical protein
MPMLSGNTLFEAEDAASLASLDPVSQVITTADKKGYVTGETSTLPREIRTVMRCDRHRYLNYVSNMQRATARYLSNPPSPAVKSPHVHHAPFSPS